MADLQPASRRRSIHWPKRLFDIVGAATALLVFSPVLVMVSLIILCKDGLPVLHRDCRAGIHGTPFQLLKFRTLRPGTGAQSRVAPEDDPRITTTGRWLRRWRLDELPQLLNVLKGELSMVGPRPIPPHHMESLPKTVQSELTSVRPGVTDPAALLFLAEDSVLAGHADAETIYLKKLLPAKAELQLDYIRHRSMLEDLRVVARTLALLWSPVQRRRSAETIRRLLE